VGIEHAEGRIKARAGLTTEDPDSLVATRLATSDWRLYDVPFPSGVRSLLGA
jgi:hypothetical protein